MMIFRKMARVVSIFVITGMLGLGFHTAAHGAIVGTGATINAEKTQQLRDLLARDDVQTQLVTLGVDPTEAMARVNSMTDDEITALTGNLENLPAGGDALGTLALIFIVLLITDILGYTDIFPFVKSKK